MDPGIRGCLPGGATYHGCGYKVISDIFTKIAISPKVLSGFHSNLYTRFTKLVCIYGLSQVAPPVIFEISWPFKFSKGHFAATLFIPNCSAGTINRNIVTLVENDYRYVFSDIDISKNIHTPPKHAP